jgi:hypothetical protein
MRELARWQTPDHAAHFVRGGARKTFLRCGGAGAGRGHRARGAFTRFFNRSGWNFDDVIVDAAALLRGNGLRDDNLFDDGATFDLVSYLVVEPGPNRFG